LAHTAYIRLASAPSTTYTSPETLDRNELIAACIKKKPSAQKVLYDRYVPSLYPVCYRYAGNKMDAEDILQEGFIKIYAHIGKLQEPKALEGWMKRIMVNTALKLLAKRKRLAENAELDDLRDLGYDPSVIHSMTEKEILRTIATLPDGYRAVFNMYAIEGYKHKEIAEMLQIEESTSRTQLLKARKLLMKKLGKWRSLLV